MHFVKIKRRRAKQTIFPFFLFQEQNPKAPEKTSIQRVPLVALRKHSYLEAIWSSFKKYFVLIACEIGILVLGAFLLQWGLLDVRTLVSVVISEVGIAVVLYYILGGHRREHEAEIVNLAEEAETFSHLKGYYFPVFPFPFSYWYYYVENTETNQYYRAPDYVERMIDRGVIKGKECKNEKEMRDLLAKCQPNEREAELLELIKAKRSRKKPRK
jgi:hypothetical protein